MTFGTRFLWSTLAFFGVVAYLTKAPLPKVAMAEVLLPP